MCGICVSVSCCSESCKFDKQLFESLKRRGPDYFGTQTDNYEGIICTFHTSVLHLRGLSCAVQPYCDEFGNILSWNGEIFNGHLYAEGKNSDTVIITESLQKTESVEDTLNVFRNFIGPYAFIYFQKKEKLLWFGRDIFGRRSLLWNLVSSGLCFNLSSVALTSETWTEVPCDAIYCIDVMKTQELHCFSLIKYFYEKSPSGTEHDHSLNIFSSNEKIIVQTSVLTISSPISSSLNHELPSSVIDNDISGVTNGESVLKKHLDDLEINAIVTKFETVLSEAVKCRILNHQFLCKNCFEIESLQCDHASVGVLFSGGIDSMVISALADKFVPVGVPIDLLNVAFGCSKKRSFKHCASKEANLQDISFDTPDRLTGKSGFEELKQINPERSWNFIQINISTSELEQERKKRISNLVIPSCTVLDDSIGCAVWFAARGLGNIEINNSVVSYCSPARVVLVGMGADEQLAGYSRHRVKFGSDGWNGLIDELALELDRISSRNLGRDDRIISDHGREARFPFLDENVVSFLNGLPVWLKANLHYPRGIGEKLLLRLLAYKLGLKSTSLLPKRAIQFGSRIARCENTKEKGSDICHRLKLAPVSNLEIFDNVT